MKKIYLDQASTTYPKPECVAKAVYEYMTGNGSNINRGCYENAYDTEEVVLETRELLCELFDGPDCKNVVFTVSQDRDPQAEPGAEQEAGARLSHQNFALQGPTWKRLGWGAV